MMQFVVKGPIKGKERARTFYDSKIGKHRSITPGQTVMYQNLVQLCYRTSEGVEQYMDGEAVGIVIHAYFDIPKSYSKRKREMICDGKLYPTKKPDADNIGKIICDALNGVAFKDDSQIVELTVKKYYTELPEQYVVVGLYKV